METQQNICPWWLGYTMINPLRKYQHNPDKILAPFVKSGMTVLDDGCAMGYFSLHMARMVRNEGIVADNCSKLIHLKQLSATFVTPWQTINK